MNRVRYVYVMSHPIGFHKIGWSFDPIERLRQLNQSSPVPVELCRTWPCVKASRVERLCHKRLHAHRAQGEWFGVPLDQAEGEVILAISDVLAERPWKRRSRLPAPVSKRPGIRWTDRRVETLRIRWESGASSRSILDELLAMPGTSMGMSAVSDKARMMGFRRPAGFRNTHNSNVWTPERDTCLRRMFPDGMMSNEIIAALNCIPGDTIVAWITVSSRAAMFRLRRPEWFAAALAEHFKLSPRWPAERNAFLNESYPSGMLPRAIMEGLLRLPGDSDLTWEIVRERAKHYGLHRPKGFTRTNAAEINRQATEFKRMSATVH